VTKAEKHMNKSKGLSARTRSADALGNILCQKSLIFDQKSQILVSLSDTGISFENREVSGFKVWGGCD